MSISVCDDKLYDALNSMDPGTQITVYKGLFEGNFGSDQEVVSYALTDTRGDLIPERATHCEYTVTLWAQERKNAVSLIDPVLRVLAKNKIATSGASENKTEGGSYFISFTATVSD